MSLMISRYFLSFVLLFSVHASVFAESGEEDAILKELQQSAEATRNLSYQGKMEFYSFSKDHKWKAGFDLYYDSSSKYCVVFEEPELMRDHVLVRNSEGVFVTPVSEEIRDRIRHEMEFFPWERMLGNKDRSFFHCMEDVKDLKLFLENYRLARFESNPKAKRETKGVSIQCRYSNRPSVKVYIDRDSGIQLKCKKFDCSQKIVEAIYFSSISINPSLPDSLFDVSKLKKIYSFPREDTPQEAVQLAFVPKIVNWLPKAFVKVDDINYLGFQGPTNKQVFSDGFSSLSIFQRQWTGKEKKKIKESHKNNQSSPQIVNKLVRRGQDVFFMDCSGLRITAVGDIPPKEITDTLTRMINCKKK